jgi:regulatory protein
MPRRFDDDKPRKPQPSAYNKALGLLARREQSAKELRRKLDRQGYEADEAGAALDRLQDQSFQNDDRFAASLARTRYAQGHGPRRILAELRTHGLDDDACRAALEETDGDWVGSARRQYQRRYGGKPAPDREETARRAAFLLRRGFDAATVRAITHAADVDDSADDFD